MKVQFNQNEPKLAQAFGISVERQNELAELNDQFLIAESEKSTFTFGQYIAVALDRATTVEEVAFLMYVTAKSKEPIEALLHLNALKGLVNEQMEGEDNDN